MKCDAATIGLIGTIFGIIGAIAALIFGLRLWLKDKKHDDRNAGQVLGVVQSDIGYIKSGVDDLKVEVRDLRSGQSDLAERVTRAEDSAKQAHKRIDELIKKE